MTRTAVQEPDARSGYRGALALGTLALFGAVAAALVAIHVPDPPVRRPDGLSAGRALGVALYVFVGTYTSLRRPGSRFGLYLTGAGLLYVVATLTVSPSAPVHTVGRIALAAFGVCLTYIFLCFPHDALGSRLERRVFAAFAACVSVLWLAILPIAERLPTAGPLTDCGASCPGNALQVVDAPATLTKAVGYVGAAVTGVGLVAVALLLLAKARSPTRLRRRLVVPLLACAALQAVTFVAYTVLRQAGVGGLDGLRGVSIVASLAVPVAMLVGEVRGRVFAATTLGGLVDRFGGRAMTHEKAQLLLRETLGDPTLQLLLWDAERGSYVDDLGRAVELPTGGREVAVTPLSRQGARFAAVVHDTLVDDTSGVARGVTATTLLLLENTRLIEELRSSRARIVASERRGRLRLERDLHDGAQQRLFAIQVRLDIVRERISDPEIASELERIAADVAAGVVELRALAHGLYPAVLRERGLHDALRSIALGAPIPVTVAGRDVGRCSESVEEAVYFCAREAIQNAAKHAGGGARVTVTLARRGEELEVSISDDGSGFEPAVHGTGMGLASMRDRIGAVGGDLEIVSRHGEGTTVVARLPAPQRESAPTTREVGRFVRSG